jgi:hypothetical protein
MLSRPADAVATRRICRRVNAMVAVGKEKSPAAAAAGLFHLFPWSVRSGEQTCSREHDPGDERSDAGK